ncbi:MFS transporter [Streptomyces spinoverrucosus]|uniref:MFS transporter n=1 Tax=Streptomyces spinoverrucosus TaxID=284043 RepID=UPI0018C3DE15|nr:MFS transporter [Streptomyces spinoverrucosus]MBG0855820.1 MFS transporter [Streptomyces spinoverrucosus]
MTDDRPEQADRPTVWHSGNFLLLWGGQTVAELGSRISSVAVPLLAAETLDASVFQISLLTTLAWLPYLLISLPAGLLADRVDQRKLMIACDLGRMALMLSLPVASIAGALSLGYLYAVVGISGVLTVLFNVAYRAKLPRLLRPGAPSDALRSVRFTAAAGSAVDGPELHVRTEDMEPVAADATRQIRTSLANTGALPQTEPNPLSSARIVN